MGAMAIMSYWGAKQKKVILNKKRKGFEMKLVRVLLLVVVTLVPITSVGWAGSALNEILSSGKLLAGTTGDFNPFSIRDAATNKYQGYVKLQF